MFQVAAAITAWFVTAFILGFVSPEGDAGAQLIGAAAFGATAGLTLWPLLWAIDRTPPGSLATSGRRSFLAGGAVSILVILRAIDVVSPVIVIFVLVGVVVIEVAFRLRR
jgi:hypothetical protein